MNHITEFQLKHLRNMAKGVDLFNRGFFWECHEELEDAWMEEVDEPRNVYWAVIQVAISLYHYRNENLIGARDMMVKAQEKIRWVKRDGLENDLMLKFLSWKRFSDLVLSFSDQNSKAMLEKIDHFKFPKPDKWEQHFASDD